jgi:hypothetical protein
LRSIGAGLRPEWQGFDQTPTGGYLRKAGRSSDRPFVFPDSLIGDSVRAGGVLASYSGSTNDLPSVEF